MGATTTRAAGVGSKSLIFDGHLWALKGWAPIKGQSANLVHQSVDPNAGQCVDMIIPGTRRSLPVEADLGDDPNGQHHRGNDTVISERRTPTVESDVGDDPNGQHPNGEVPHGDDPKGRVGMPFQA